jgi:hypothetical protein
MPAATGTRAGAAGARSGPAASKPGSRPQAVSNSVDHWSMVLFYAMGVGVVALIVLFILTLAVIGLYGQFVWTFTHWDLSSVKSELVQPWAHFAMIMAFSLGTCFGVWFFGGYAWKNLKNRRVVNAASRARRSSSA